MPWLPGHAAAASSLATATAHSSPCRLTTAAHSKRPLASPPASPLPGTDLSQSFSCFSFGTSLQLPLRVSAGAGVDLAPFAGPGNVSPCATVFCSVLRWQFTRPVSSIAARQVRGENRNIGLLLSVVVLQIGSERSQLLAAELRQVRHQCPGFEVLRMHHPCGQRCRVVRKGAACNAPTTSNMREIRAHLAVRAGATHRVAEAAGRGFECAPAESKPFFGWLWCWFALCFEPGLVHWERLGDHAQAHVRVLCSTVLGTLSLEHASLRRLQPHVCGLARQHVDF